LTRHEPFIRETYPYFFGERRYLYMDKNKKHEANREDQNDQSTGRSGISDKATERQPKSQRPDKNAGSSGGAPPTSPGKG
jgi:hypothetical protein